MPQIYSAQYRPAALKSMQNNPLIEALTDYLDWTPRSIIATLTRRPEPMPPEATRRQLSGFLNELPTDFFLPMKRQFVLFETIDLLIRQGYKLRNPTTPERAQYLRDAYARLQTGETLESVSFAEEKHEQLTASLIGTSGMGKTKTVEQILSLYPQLIQHNRASAGGPFLQITHIMVECPHDGSVKALCGEILKKVDELTDNRYCRRFRITDRTTLETMKSAVAHVLAMHYVGILVIDEIQNLQHTHKNREDLFNFVVSLSNSLNVPLLFVGTPKIHSFLTSNVRTARRFGTRGFITWQPLEYDSAEWKRFMSELWLYNCLSEDETQMPEEIGRKLYECSCGIIDILLKLFILTQMRVLVLTARNAQIPKKLTAPLIEAIFEEFFQNFKPIQYKLLRGDKTAILKLEDISMPEEMSGMIEQMQDQIDEALMDRLTDEDAEAKKALNASMAYAGNELPPLAQDIGKEFLEGEKTES